MAKKEGVNFLPIIYAIFGIYLINKAIVLFQVPEYLLNFDKWIIAFGGLLLFVAMYRMIIYSKKRIIKRAIKANK